MPRPKGVVQSLIVIGTVLGLSIAVYSILVLSSGLGQPLVLGGSRSMEPTIGDGDIIAVHYVVASQIHLGDVIIYDKSNTGFLIIHRVVCIVTATSSQCTGSFYV